MSEFLDAVEEGIKEHWPWLLVFILGFFIWKYDQVYNLVRGFLPLAGTATLGYIAWKLWIHYVQQDFISGVEFVLLEIIPQRDVLRSPKAMELFLTNALYHFSFKGGAEQYWQGAVWFWFSLEIASIDGQVHFYIRTPTRMKSLIETQMYAQYPQAQVKVVEDYTLAVDEITPSSAWNAWGCEFGLEKNQVYPIKTYTDFGLDKDPKEEYKVDPISPIIELFGSIQKGEQMWMQIIITPSKKEYHTHGTWFGHHDWVKEAKVQLDKLLAPYSSYKDAKVVEDIGIGRSRIEIRVPPFLDDIVKKIRAKTSKLGFDTGVRVCYVAKKEIYPMGSRTNNSRDIRLLFRQYTAPDSNGLKRINSTQGDAMSHFGFVGLSPQKVMILANRMVHEYQERAFFHLPMRHHLFSKHTIKFPLSLLVMRFFMPYFHHETFVLNVEEIASLWHFPGQILKVPTLTRIESKEASPPSNLPI